MPGLSRYPPSEPSWGPEMTGADMQRLARAIDDLDSLSGGRTIIAIGIGHAVQEFEAVGVPFNQRGRMADEYLEAIRVLWTEDSALIRRAFRAVRRRPLRTKTPPKAPSAHLDRWQLPQLPPACCTLAGLVPVAGNPG